MPFALPLLLVPLLVLLLPVPGMVPLLVLLPVPVLVAVVVPVPLAVPLPFDVPPLLEPLAVEPLSAGGTYPNTPRPSSVLLFELLLLVPVLVVVVSTRLELPKLLFLESWLLVEELAS